MTKTPLKISKRQKIRLAMRAVRLSKKQTPQNNFCGKAAVIGAGIAGMAIATRLLYEGFDVEVFEARNSIGGKACKINAFGAELDNASHAAMGCYKNLFGAIELLGNGADEFFESVSGMDFICAGKAKVTVKYPPKGSLAAGWLSALSYAKLDGFASARNIALLLSIKLGIMPRENETAAEFLARKKIPGAAVENFWRPFCVSALNTAPERADARLMTATLKKSVLKGFESALLYLPTKPIASAFEIFGVYLRGCGGKINFGDPAKQINFEGKRAVSLQTCRKPPIHFVNCCSV